MKKRRARRGPPRPAPRPEGTLVVLPHPPRDRLHPVLQLELLLLQRGLLDLLFVAQDRLVVELAQAGLVLVMLLVKPSVFLVLEETLREGTGVLGHRHLRNMKERFRRQSVRRAGRIRGPPSCRRYHPVPVISRLISWPAEPLLAQHQ